MKLLYLANARMPTEKAHGYQIAKMCACYAQRGVSVALIVPTRRNALKEDVFTYYGIAHNFRVQKLTLPDCIRWSPYIGAWAYWLQTLVYALRVGVMRIDDDTVVLTRQPEVVWLMRLRGKKTVYECHDWLPKGREKLYVRFLRKANGIITTNSHIKRRFVASGFEERNILVAPNGIDLGVFALTISKEDARAQLDIDNALKKKLHQSVMLLYTGSYTTMGVDKGIHTILEALKELHTQIRFVAVGGNEKDIARYRREAKEADVADQVYLFGRKNQHLLAIYQRAADVLLMPFPKKAHYAYYMSPLKTFEYMASGVPIIASDLPSMREILDETSCTFCAPDNAHNLAEKINFVLSQRESMQQKAIRAREIVATYTWEKRAERILQWIGRVTL